jgi:hypothetical protein
MRVVDQVGMRQIRVRVQGEYRWSVESHAAEGGDVSRRQRWRFDPVDAIALVASSAPFGFSTTTAVHGCTWADDSVICGSMHVGAMYDIAST